MWRFTHYSSLQVKKLKKLTDTRHCRRTRGRIVYNQTFKEKQLFHREKITNLVKLFAKKACLYSDVVKHGVKIESKPVVRSSKNRKQSENVVKNFKTTVKEYTEKEKVVKRFQQNFRHFCNDSIVLKNRFHVLSTPVVDDLGESMEVRSGLHEPIIEKRSRRGAGGGDRAVVTKNLSVVGEVDEARLLRGNSRFHHCRIQNMIWD